MFEMLKEFDSKTFYKYFPENPHPFISELFFALNRGKADQLIFLIEEGNKPMIGLAAGIKEDIICSPFSAPFGGFHFRKENIYISEVDRFISLIKDFIMNRGLKGMRLTLPPDIYQSTFNAKAINSLIRHGFVPDIPELTSWVCLDQFKDSFSQKNSREYYRQAVRKGLAFEKVDKLELKEVVYKLIAGNRARFGRPMYMSFQDVLDTGNLWPANFFSITSQEGEMVAAAIFYPYMNELCYAVFWGDTEAGRPLRAMDFMAFNVWMHYKNLGFRYIDLGISTQEGVPNEGLLRFKETHESTSSLRFTLVWHNKKP